MNRDQVFGALQAFIPLATALFVGWGLDSETAGLGAAGVIGLVCAGISFMSHRDERKIRQVAAMPDGPRRVQEEVASVEAYTQ